MLYNGPFLSTFSALPIQEPVGQAFTNNMPENCLHVYSTTLLHTKCSVKGLLHGAKCTCAWIKLSDNSYKALSLTIYGPIPPNFKDILRRELTCNMDSCVVLHLASDLSRARCSIRLDLLGKQSCRAPNENRIHSATVPTKWHIVYTLL